MLFVIYCGYIKNDLVLRKHTLKYSEQGARQIQFNIQLIQEKSEQRDGGQEERREREKERELKRVNGEKSKRNQ